ncbi:hypothetical protein VKT23_009671 [Stygiomarasmius scandens]|uniref:Zinc finger PHD-type domain-containing protein n=1 Tax=Marasmiellus scandens TaxID=2682957 RepID=A0ABR1JH46_9AGAR
MAGSKKKAGGNKKPVGKKGYSAQKSTGGEAPRKALGTGSVPEVPKETRATKKRKLETSVDGDSDLDSDSAEAGVTFASYAKIPDGAQWCRGCNDNTELPKLTCESCQHFVCYGKPKSGACLEISTKLFSKPTWSRFICPGCEFMQNKKKGGTGGVSTYSGFYDSDDQPIKNVIVNIRNREYSFFKQVKLEKLAIVQIEVAGASSDFAVPFKMAVLRASSFSSGEVDVRDVLQHNLRSPNSLNLVPSPQPLLTSKIEFDFDTAEGAGRYESDLIELRNAVEAMGIARILFFVVTHSDPNSGDLHYTANGGGAERLKVVMKRLFPSVVEEWLRSKETYLHLLVCGSKPLMMEGFSYLTDIVTRRVFNHVFLFPTVNLQPTEIAPFTTNFIKFGLYQNENFHKAVTLSLEGLLDVGHHTRIICLSYASGDKDTFHATRYVWTHSTRRPWGLDMPTHCSACNGIKTFKSANRVGGKRNAEVIMKCTGVEGCACTKEVRVYLTDCESRLEQGSKEHAGLWQCHKFAWEEALMERV